MIPPPPILTLLSFLLRTTSASNPLLPRALLSPTNPLLLQARQGTVCTETTCSNGDCIPSGYHCCADGAGCPFGSDCVPGGCCDAGQSCNGGGGGTFTELGTLAVPSLVSSASVLPFFSVDITPISSPTAALGGSASSIVGSGSGAGGAGSTTDTDIAYIESLASVYGAVASSREQAGATTDTTAVAAASAAISALAGKGTDAALAGLASLVSGLESRASSRGQASGTTSEAVTGATATLASTGAGTGSGAKATSAEGSEPTGQGQAVSGAGRGGLGVVVCGAAFAGALGVLVVL